MPNFVKTKLIKRQTLDGLGSVLPNVPLGKSYLVDLDTRRKAKLFNTDMQIYHDKEVIDDENGKWLFVELLDIGIIH